MPGEKKQKTKKPRKTSQYRKKKKIQYQWKSFESTLILDFN